MSTENNPGVGQNEAQQPGPDTDIQQSRQANAAPSFRLATEGPSFDPIDQDNNTNVLNASRGTSGVGVGRTPGMAPIPSSSPTPDRQQTPGKSHRGRNVLLATATAVGLAGVIGGALGLTKINSGGSESGEGVSGVATEEASPSEEASETAEPSEEASETATEVPSETATQAPTETSTPTEIPATEGSKGNVATIKELNIPETQKDVIENKILEGATPQIIVEENGQVVIIAIDNDVLEGNLLGGLKSIELNNAKFPDAGKRLAGLVLEGKYQAYMSKSGNTSLTLDEYIANGGSFPQHAEDVVSGNYANYDVDRNSPFVLVVAGDVNDNCDRVDLAVGASLAPQVGNGVYATRLCQLGAPVVGEFNEDQIQRFEYQFAFDTEVAIKQLMDKVALGLQGKGKSNFNDPTLDYISNEIFHPYVFDINPDTGMAREKVHYPSIFITK